MRRDPRRHAPVFVLSFPRSYSSVVTTMLGQHPELAGLPELKLFLYRTLAELDASLPARLRAEGIAHRSPGLVRAIALYVFGDQSPRSAAAALAWLHERADWTGAEALDVILELAKPCATVEKSPENVATAAALRRISSAFPRARFIHLVRHPVTTMRSLDKHWRATMPSDPLPDPMVSCLASWLDTNRRIVRFGAMLPEERFLQVRAEHVLNDGDAQLRRIARWLGVRDDDHAVAAMRHPEMSPFARFGPPGVIGGNDHGFLREPVPHPAALPPTFERPPQLEANSALWTAVIETSHELGYAGSRGRIDRVACA